MLGVIGCLSPEVLAYEHVIPKERGVVGVKCGILLSFSCMELACMQAAFGTYIAQMTLMAACVCILETVLHL